MVNVQASSGVNRQAEVARDFVPTFGDLYNQTFTVVKADTPALLEQVFKLRYQIYCVENQFEDPSHFPDGLESDAYDAHSIHYLLMHNVTGLAVGSVRMVLPLMNGVQQTLPIHKVCPDITELNDLNYARYASEISRFCISKDMRRRITDGAYPGSNEVNQLPYVPDKRVLSCAVLGLIRACIEVVQEHDIDHTYLICEPTLLRLLSKAGVCSTPRGPLVEYHGLRQPVLVNNDTQLLENTKRDFPDVWSVLSDNGRLKPRVRKPALQPEIDLLVALAGRRDSTLLEPRA